MTQVQYKPVEVAQIGSRATQMRTEDEDRISDRVAEYHADLQSYRESSGDEAAYPWPPLDGFYDQAEGIYYVGDGWQRLAASRRQGDTAVMMAVHSPAEMDEEDAYRAAMLWAVGANAKPGSIRSNAAKRKSIETMLRDDQWVTWTDRTIARYCKVDHKTVGDVRSELEAAGEIQPQPQRRMKRGTSEFTRATQPTQPSPLLGNSPYRPEDDAAGESGVATEVDAEPDTEPDPGTEPWDLPVVGEDYLEYGEVETEAEDDAEVVAPAVPTHVVPTPGPEHVHEQRMADWNAPFLRLRKVIREERKQIRSRHESSIPQQFPSATFQALDNPLGEADQAITPCLGVQLCPACGGPGCAQCKRLGWLNAVQAEQAKRLS